MKSLMKLDPFRALRTWEPFDDLRRMQQEMDRIFDRFLEGRSLRTEHEELWVPAMDSYVKDDRLILRCELPGVDPKELEVSITDREIVIKGERKASKEEKDKDYLVREISYGTFERHFALPEGTKTDDLKARFENGVLELSVPVPARAKTRKIEIDVPKKTEGETSVRKAA